MPRVPLCLPIVLCLAQGMLCVVAAHTDHAPTFRIRSIPPWHVSPSEARVLPPPVSDVSDARPRGYLAAAVWHCVATSGAIVRFVWAPIVCLWEAFVTVVFLWPYRAPGHARPDRVRAIRGAGRRRVPGHRRGPSRHRMAVHGACLV